MINYIECIVPKLCYIAYEDDNKKSETEAKNDYLLIQVEHKIKLYVVINIKH